MGGSVDNRLDMKPKTFVVAEDKRFSGKPQLKRITEDITNEDNESDLRR